MSNEKPAADALMNVLIGYAETTEAARDFGAMLDAVRAEALEEAALVCEDTDVSSLDDAADRIRALKETT